MHLKQRRTPAAALWLPASLTRGYTMTKTKDQKPKLAEAKRNPWTEEPLQTILKRALVQVLTEHPELRPKGVTEATLKAYAEELEKLKATTKSGKKK